MTTQLSIEIETAPGVWIDITDDVYQRDPVVISRGKGDQQSLAAPQRLTFTLDNRSGRYSPRNPLSDLYGKIGRNTPIRCEIDFSDGFHGEIADLPPLWDPSHSDHYIQVEANGILRRLGQGQPPVSTALRDFVIGADATHLASLAAYYPLSGGEETIYSQNLAPGKTGSFRGSGGAVFKYGVDMGAAWLGSGMELNATGDLPYMEGTGNATASNVALDFVFQSPALGVLDVQLWPTLDSIFNLRLNTSADAGTLQVSYYDDTVGTLNETATGVIAALQDTELHTCRFELNTAAGPNINYLVYIDGVLVDSGSNSLGQTLSRVPIFRFHYSRFTNQTVMNMAHLTLWADNTAANIPTATAFKDAAFCYAGETAVDRIIRICANWGVPIGTQGVAAESTVMGPQFSESRLAQIRDAEATDMGILFEERGSASLHYRSRTSMYNQSPQFTLNYKSGQVSPPLAPVDDDQATRNDVTATRREGGSARVAIDTGPLSTQDPPDGVGRYDDEVTVNVETDNQLAEIAGWVANIGTLDKARWPSVTVNLSAPPITADADLVSAIKDANIGDRFVISGMQEAFINDDVSLIIVGYTETINPFVHTITFNCMPAEPYEVFVVDDPGSRISSGETSLVNATMTATTTSMSVLSADAVTLWTTSGGQMPISIMVAGEEMTVTAITGTTPGSAQTFTVTRSVNGVVKTHASGEIVRLKRRAVLAL
jgi:hypothetical protein